MLNALVVGLRLYCQLCAICTTLSGCGRPLRYDEPIRNMYVRRGRIETSWRDCAKAVRPGAIRGLPRATPVSHAVLNGTHRVPPTESIAYCRACASLRNTLLYLTQVSAVRLDVEESSTPFEATTDDNYHTFTQLRLVPTIRLISSEHSRHLRVSYNRFQREEVASRVPQSSG